MMKFGVDNAVKPILIVTVDGGPDENPQHQKVIETSIIYFLPDNLFYALSTRIIILSIPKAIKFLIVIYV